MKKVKSLLALAVLFFVAAGVLATGYFIKSPTNVNQQAAASTNLSISPVKQTLGAGQNLTFSVNMDTGNNKITGIDMILNFDPQVIQIGSIQRGSGIGSLNNTLRQNFDNSAGTISFATFTLDKSQAVSGSALEVLTVTARITNSATFGNSLISFDPSTAIAATSETQNVLAGGIPGTITIANVTPSPTPVVTATPTPTSAPGQPNSCGGTCGSNINCGSNLYCYQGYCRNPSCGWSTDCTCNSTVTPAPTQAPTAAPTYTPTRKPTVTVTATPSPVVVVMTPTPTPNNFWQTIFNSQSPTPIPSPTLAPAASTAPVAVKTFDLLPWIIGSLVVAGLAIILIVVGIIRESGMHRAKPPVIKV